MGGLAALFTVSLGDRRARADSGSTPRAITRSGGARKGFDGDDQVEIRPVAGLDQQRGLEHHHAWRLGGDLREPFRTNGWIPPPRSQRAPRGR